MEVGREGGGRVEVGREAGGRVEVGSEAGGRVEVGKVEGGAGVARRDCHSEWMDVVSDRAPSLTLSAHHHHTAL